MRTGREHFIHLNTLRASLKTRSSDVAAQKRQPPPRRDVTSEAKATHLMEVMNRGQLTRSLRMSVADTRAAQDAGLQRGAENAKWLASTWSSAPEHWKAADPRALITLKPDIGTPQLCDALQRRFPKAVVERGTDKVTVDVSQLSIDDAHAAQLDTRLAKNMPPLAVENIFASFATFKGRELSQRLAAARAAQFCAAKDADRAVLMLEGEAGSGKSHLAAAAAKASFAAGRKVVWITPDKIPDLTLPGVPHDFFIDNLPDGYGDVGRAYIAALQHVERYGGRLLCTTTNRAEELITSAARSSRNFLDANQLVVTLTAPSQRAMQPWWLGPAKTISASALAFERARFDTMDLDRSLVTYPFRAALEANFPYARLVEHRSANTIDALRLTDDELVRLAGDVEFYRAHPDLSAESVFARFENFDIRTEQQRAAVEAYRQLLDYDGPSGATLVHRGDPGTGKTHLAVSLAKEATARGAQTFFITPQNAASYESIDFPANAVIILTDANSAFTSMGSVLRNAILAVHNRSARLLITTNADTEALVQEATAGRRAEKKIFSDRLRVMRHEIVTTGPSERLKHGWYTQHYGSAPMPLAPPPRRAQDVRTFSPAVATAGFIEALTKSYPGVVLEHADSGAVTMDARALDSKTLARLLSDLRFLDAHPTTPQALAFARLDNFEPRNDGERRMLEQALHFLAYDGAKPAGLGLQGATGTGKSHIAIGVAKALLDRGQRTVYVDGSARTISTNTTVGPGTVIILDGVEDGFTSGGKLLSKLVADLHERGGRVVITSGDVAKALADSVGAEVGNPYPALADRFAANFVTVRADGPSYRASNNWLSATPWAQSDSEPIGPAGETKALDVSLDVVARPFLDRLVTRLPGADLVYDRSAGLASIDLRKCAPANRQRLVDDIVLYQTQGSLPAEMAGLRFDKLQPGDAHSRQAIETAQRLAASPAAAAGIIIGGRNGDGAELLALATLRELAAQGRKVVSVNEYTSAREIQSIAPGSVIYARRMDTPYGEGETAQALLDFLEQRGGRLVMTSALDHAGLAARMRRASGGREQLQDRVAALLPAVTVTRVTTK